MKKNLWKFEWTKEENLLETESIRIVAGGFFEKAVEI